MNTRTKGIFNLTKFELDDEKGEIQKCKNNPYYFATKYIRVSISNTVSFPFTTHLTEEEFNKQYWNYHNKKEVTEEFNIKGKSLEELLDCKVSKENYNKRELPDFVFTQDYSIDNKALYLKNQIYDTYHYNYDRLVSLLMERIIKIV